MSILSELDWRGLIQDCSNREEIENIPSGTSFYTGIDPTAPSLQLGNLIPLISTIHLAKAGLKAIYLFGGATGEIGDPSGKSTERKLLKKEVVKQNLQKQQEQVLGLFKKFGLEVSFVNNLDWTREISYLDFLRDTGKFLTVNYMLAKDVVRSRLDAAGISYTEFSYMLIQANDFLHLYEEHDCKLQIGGSDQWGNITAGLELIRKKVQGSAYAMSFPLVTDSQGRKLGKSADGDTIWLDPALTSPYKFHQYLLNLPDDEALGFVKKFTFINQDQYKSLEEEFKAKPEARPAQNYLADQLCEFIHGKEALSQAKDSAKVLFGGSFKGMSDDDLLEIFSQVPSSEFSRDHLIKMTVLDSFVETGLCNSRGDAKRLFKNGGAYLNNERLESMDTSLEDFDALKRGLLVLRSGKKQYHLVKIA